MEKFWFWLRLLLCLDVNCWNFKLYINRKKLVLKYHVKRNIVAHVQSVTKDILVSSSISNNTYNAICRATKCRHSVHGVVISNIRLCFNHFSFSLFWSISVCHLCKWTLFMITLKSSLFLLSHYTRELIQITLLSFYNWFCQNIYDIYTQK